MQRVVTRPPSRLAALEPKLRKVLPGGLPPEVERFYAEGDGMQVSIPAEQHSNTIVGLEAMFGADPGGKFLPYRPVKRGDDIDDRLSMGGPFEGIFHTDYEDETEGPRARRRIDLKLRLRLLCSVAGESTAFGIDLYGEQGAPQIYYVNEATDVLPLWLDFATFVDSFARFGAHRWYFAFLDRKSERTLNISLKDEIRSSLAPFDKAEVKALLDLAKASKERLAPRPAPKKPAS